MGTATGQEAGNVSVMPLIVRPEQGHLRRRRIKRERKDAVQ